MLTLAMLCLGLVAADDDAAYREAAARAGRDASAHVKLALWCEARGMTAERDQHLELAATSDPTNALARGLLGQVAVGGKWERPEDARGEAKDDPRQRALQQEYLDRRSRAKETAEDQYRLALWCDQNGLRAQAVAHYHAVLRQDPRREAAWKRLGFKKVGGRWVKPEWEAAAKREAGEQERGNKHWRPILERLRAGIASRDRRRREGDEVELARVTDPRAVPMIWAVFVARGAEWQVAAVRVLAQIDAPGSSRALALLALSSRSPEARGEAVQVLRHRDPRDFAPMLVAMIRDPIKYDVKAVGGPGRPGELVIEDGSTRRQRIYSPPSAPGFVAGPNDYLSFDASGLPVVNRLLGFYSTGPIRTGTTSDSQALAMFGLRQTTPGQMAAQLAGAGIPPAIAQKVGGALSRTVNSQFSFSGDPKQQIQATVAYEQMMQIPIGRMMMESQEAAQVAEMQLQGDVRAIQEYNAPIREVNRLARQVLSGAVGDDFGDDRSAWTRWLVDLFGYALAPQMASNDRATVVEQVPLAYQPQPVTPTVQTQMLGVQFVHRHSCFAAGTLVRTSEGLRPIESVRAGDLVLTQDAAVGALQYQAVVVAYHNPPNATFRVAMETGESVVATGIHRVWKAGKGWAMVRELKPGDALRTLGGTAAVKSVEADRTQPVFNLRVAEGESYFVGTSGVLAHDNSTIHPVTEPFDAVGPLESGAASAAGRSRSMLGH